MKEEYNSNSYGQKAAWFFLGMNLTFLVTMPNPLALVGVILGAGYVGLVRDDNGEAASEQSDTKSGPSSREARTASIGRPKV